MDFDPRHVGLSERRLDVEQTGRPGADESQPAPKAVRGHPSVKNVSRRHGTLRIALVEIDPEPTPAIGRHFEAGYRHRFYACLIGANQNRSGTADDPKHF